MRNLPPFVGNREYRYRKPLKGFQILLLLEYLRMLKGDIRTHRIPVHRNAQRFFGFIEFPQLQENRTIHRIKAVERLLDISYWLHLRMLALEHHHLHQRIKIVIIRLAILIKIQPFQTVDLLLESCCSILRLFLSTQVHGLLYRCIDCPCQSGFFHGYSPRC